jgi:hypothetical protein
VARFGQYVSVATFPETVFAYIPVVSGFYSTYVVQAQRVVPRLAGLRFDPIPRGTRAMGWSAQLYGPSINCIPAQLFRLVDRPVRGAIVAAWRPVTIGR